MSGGATSGGRWLAIGLLAACAAGSAFALRSLDRPGLYYDEAIQAGPALAFLRGEAPSQIPGASSTRLFGRWLPVMTQPYMGALKSQALLPSFALFGATPRTLRATTYAWTLLGVVLAALFARELLGTPVAVLTAALLALDPSLLFVGRHDWGSFALGFGLRCAGLWLAVVGWRRASPARLAGAGLCFGLGLYNKIDLAVFLAAAGLALAATAPGLVTGLRSRARDVLAFAGGLGVGAAPVLLRLPAALAVSRAFAGRQTASAPEWSEKAQTLRFALDGSYFDRLMRAGGSFRELAEVGDAAWGPFLVLFAAALAFVAVRLLRAPADDGRDPARRFVWLATLLTLAGIFATPRAVRIHHALNAAPLPQLLVATALVCLWRLGATRAWLRATAVGLAAVALLGSAQLDARTLASIEATGGRGRWSDSLDRLARELGQRPQAAVVTLDWGFSEPLRFLAPELPVVETIWRLNAQRIERKHLALEGTPDHVYLLYPPRWSVFPFGAQFLEAVRGLPEEAVEIRSVPDRGGEPAFFAVRIAKPHRLVYREALEVRLR